MHRFRKKQDLKKQLLVEYNNNLSTNNENQILTSNNTGSELPSLPSLPPTSDFRTSLILPTLTKRFSVLRRGEKANNHNVTLTNMTKISSTTQEAPSEVYNSRSLHNNTDTTNQVSVIKPGLSKLSDVMEIPNKEEIISVNSLSTKSSITSPTESVNTSNTSLSTLSISNNVNNNDNDNQQVLSNARKFYDPFIRIQDMASVNNDDDNKSGNENEENINNKNDTNEIVIQSIDMSSVKNLSSNGKLVNPIKDRPKLPSILQVPWKNDLSKNNNTTSSQLSLPNFVQSSSSSSRQISPTKSSSHGFSPRVTINDNEQDSLFQPSSPRSPLDKLSEGLYNLKVQSSPSLSPSSPLYSTHNLSQTSLRSFGGSSVNEEEEIGSLIQKKSPSINSLRNIEDENIHNGDRASTTSTIGSSLKRIRTIKTTDSNISSSNFSNNNSNNNSNNSSIDNEGDEGDDEADDENKRDSNATGIMYLKDTISDKEKIKYETQPESSSSSMTNTTGMLNITTDLQKKPSRGGTTPPPKPQPPPLSLTDTLIASGQSDIAHQVMVMRRVQNMNQQQLQSQNQFNTKQNTFRKWSKKNAGIKSISGPQLVSTSSNVKTIPIVQLGQLDDDRFRRKRESETGIGKSLRRIKDVFTSDSESALFGKKRMSLGSSNENLSRKFVSDENLNQRFINNEKRGIDFVKRRAFSTREKGKPNNKLKQDIRNNYTFMMNNEQQQLQQQLNGDDSYISSDRSSTPINTSDKSGQQPLYDIYTLKRHAEMISRYSSNKKVDNPIITSPSSSQSSSLSLTVDIPNESESVPSSPISPFSDYPSSTSTPPPISPRNPLRQPDKSRTKYSTGSQNSISDVGSDDRRDSKDSKASSRLMSIFNNYSNRSSKSSIRNSKSSDINHLQVNNNVANDGQKANNKVIRRTIIITKPYLPPLPEDSAPSTPIFPSSSANSSSSSLMNSKSALKKKKLNLDDGKIHVDRQWFLSKKASSDDEKVEDIEKIGDSTLLSIPIQKVSLSDRPPTPIPSPNTRENAMDLPYGIPIPPIPSPHRNSVASKTSKRTSKSSIASSLKSSSSKFNRKSVGSKSVYSTYGESIYDYYDYSDQEVADDEDDKNSNITNTTRRQQLETQQHVEVLEMSDGSYVWQVVNGLRGEDMEDRYSYYYTGANINDNSDDYSQIWPQDFGRLNYGRDLEDDQISQLSFNDQQNNNSHLDYYTVDIPVDIPNSSHFSDVNSSSEQKHGQYLTPDVLPSRNTNPNRLMYTNSTVSTASSNEEEKFIPRTSVYFAKDVPLPKLLEEMSKGLGSVDLDREEIHYVYGGEVGAGGTGVVGETTVEEKLDQVMRALGVDERDVYID